MTHVPDKIKDYNIFAVCLNKLHMSPIIRDRLNHANAQIFKELILSGLNDVDCIEGVSDK